MYALPRVRWAQIRGSISRQGGQSACREDEVPDKDGGRRKKRFRRGRSSSALRTRQTPGQWNQVDAGRPDISKAAGPWSPRTQITYVPNIELQDPYRERVL